MHYYFSKAWFTGSLLLGRGGRGGRGIRRHHQSTHKKATLGRSHGKIVPEHPKRRKKAVVQLVIAEVYSMLHDVLMQVESKSLPCSPEFQKKDGNVAAPVTYRAHPKFYSQMDW
jgi:hypothetical protein